MAKSTKMYWKVHTPNLLKELCDGALATNNMGILFQPLNIFKNMLTQVAERAIELHDPELDLIMMRLCLYEQADPSSKDYNPKAFELLEKEIRKNKRLKAKASLTKP